MRNSFYQQLDKQLAEIRAEGLFKEERVIISAQDAHIRVTPGRDVINFCANNYLGLANHPTVIAAAHTGLDSHGFGMASVRFICGTQDLHKELEERLAKFLGTEACILYPSCFDANGGLFETLLGEEDAVISDQLNHASIIDGIRLSKAQRHRYANNNMSELETRLQETQSVRHRLIATDGVFSMDGICANLKAICDLADRYDALVMVDDCHAVGFMGDKGRGTHEACGVMGRIDLISGTLGKALGGATGGYIAGRQAAVDWLRQRSRPYVFSNSIAPSVAAASLAVLELIEGSDDLRHRLHENSAYFRKKMTAAGFTLVPGSHPIIPVMLGEAKVAQEFAARMLNHGIYVVGFSFPVVPRGQARIRTQMSAAHSRQDLDRAVEAFVAVGRELAVVV